MTPQPPPTNPKIEELRARLKADPKSRHFYPLAEELRKVGRYAEAEQVLRDGLAVHPNYLSAYMSFARVLKEQGKNGEAIESIKKALQLDPGNVVAARLAAETYLALGEKVEAIKKFKLVQALLPSDETIEAEIERLDRELNPEKYGGVAIQAATAEPVASAVSETTAATDQPEPVEQAEPLPAAASAVASPVEADPFDNEPAAEQAAPQAAVASTWTTTDEIPALDTESSEESEDVFTREAALVEPPRAEEGSAAFEAQEQESVWEDETPLAAQSTDTLLLQDLRSEMPEETPAAAAPTPREAEAARGDLFDAEPARQPEVPAAPETEAEVIQERESLFESTGDFPSQPEDSSASAFEPAGETAPASGQAVFGEWSDSRHDSEQAEEVLAEQPQAEPAPSDDALGSPLGAELTATVTMADLYAQQGHFDAARDIYRRILDRDPNNAEVQARLASIDQTTSGDPKRRKVERLNAWLARVGKREHAGV